MATLAIAGTWRACAGSEFYQFAESAGALFAAQGWNIVTGGYSGVMDAGLKGASEYDVSARALTWRNLDGVLPVSAHAKQVTRFESIAKRAGALIGEAQAVLVMPGRTGTAAELALAVEARAKHQLELPVLVYQNYWDDFFAWLAASNNRLGLAADAESADAPPLFHRVFTLDDVAAVLRRSGE